MTVRLLVVCEAPADFRTATDLADRVFCERIDWLDESLLPTQRTWTETDPGRPYLRWTDLDRAAAARNLRLRPRSRFGGEPGAADAAAADKALQFAAFLAPDERPAAVLLIRDSDDQPERRRGLAQASTREPGHAWPFHVVIGLAHPKREAWVLAGFEPRDPDEHARLATLRSELGHDPCTSSDQLTARTPGSKRDAKRVVAHLTADDRDREAHCWQTAPLARLHARGEANGLAAYLGDLDDHIVPLLGRP